MVTELMVHRDERVLGLDGFMFKRRRKFTVSEFKEIKWFGGRKSIKIGQKKSTQVHREELTLWLYGGKRKHSFKYALFLVKGSSN